MKAKELKLLRKNLARVNKPDFDPLTGIPGDELKISLGEGNENAVVACKPAKQADDKTIQKCIDLFEENMGDYYRNSSWGLDLKEKREELTHENARLLLVSSEENQLVAFVHFRFEYDDEERPNGGVFYLYEIQVDKSAHRKGLGKKLMNLSEKISAGATMDKVVLTVFKNNEGALSFYKTLGYSNDVSCPSNFNDPADYVILSKATPTTK